MREGVSEMRLLYYLFYMAFGKRRYSGAVPQITFARHSFGAGLFSVDFDLEKAEADHGLR